MSTQLPFKINHPFDPQPLGDDEKQWEQPCGVCGQPLIMEVGDAMSAYIGDSGELEAILCNKCAEIAPKPIEDDTGDGGPPIVHGVPR